MQPPATTQMSPPARWRRYAGIAVAVISWLALLVALGLWWLLQEADHWWPATLLMFSPRCLLLLPFLLLLPAGVWLRRRALVPQAAALLIVLGPVSGFCVPWGNLFSGPAGGTHVRILTCNLHYQKTDLPALARLLAESPPDVVVLQEWSNRDLPDYFAGSGWEVHRAERLLLASRFPILRASPIGEHSMRERGVVMRYELDTPGGVITVFSLHLASPRKGLQEVARESPRASVDIQAGSELRREQSENLAREADAVAGPVLLAGDFNTPPESVLFPRFWGRYTDAFGTAGWGWGYTFINRRTAVRIDHVLAGPGWQCDRCRVGPNVGSPHRPVIADLTWVGEPNP